MKREKFIENAGGVFTSSKYYSQWNGGDKATHFWNFFNSTDDEYITSVYAGVDVDELRKKKEYSIEHIIPKSFLKNYLHVNHVEKNIVKGATTNPLNFAAAHRDINSARGNFPFDVDGDRVVRSYTVKLEGIYSDYGLDRENEWVIPIRSQGDLARSILYMCLVYNIHELYGEHLNVYRHWAKIDPPSIWEIKYNDWVYKNFEIKNPLIADYNNPTTSFKMLNDKELMSSILLDRNINSR